MALLKDSLITGDLRVTGTIYGNATSADKLQTTKTIWGQNFNGTANITGNLKDIGSQIWAISGTSTIDFLTSTGGALNGKFGRIGLTDTYANIDFANYRLHVIGNSYLYKADEAGSAAISPTLKVRGKVNIEDNVISGGTKNSLLNIIGKGNHDYGILMKLHSYGGDSPAIRFSHSTSADDLDSQVNTNWSVGMLQADYNTFAITRNRGTSGWGTPDMVITSSGYVGIGLTNPNCSLEVNGRSKFSGISDSNTASSDFYNTGAVEIRECGRVGDTQSSFNYAPRIGFHWYLKTAATLSYHSDGIFYFRKQNGTDRATVDANLNGNAATATKLATTRTINGTNFDGSANITTANWGTTRTISISSTAGTTGTSVNGSGNVSLIIPSTMTGFSNITSTTFHGTLDGTATRASSAVTSDDVGYKKYWYHDLFGFCYIGTPVYYTTTDGTTWTQGTLDKAIFDEKNLTKIQIFTDSIIGHRWQWNNNSNFSHSTSEFLQLAWTYVASQPKRTVTIETSADGETWTQRGTATGAWGTTNHIIPISGFGADKYIRITILRDATATTTTFLANLRLLSQRPGDQGQGIEYEFPYTWDKDRNVWFEKCYGAVWNDYAEYRKTVPAKPGQIVKDNDDGSLSITNARLIPGAQVISDTYGFAIGETDDCKTPIAVSGRALVYTYKDRKEYHAGMAVCSAPNGTVDIMTREEIKEYPDCIIGIVSEIPSYEIWGTGKVKVDNRIWIKIK